MNVVGEVVEMGQYNIRCFRDCYRKIAKLIPAYTLPPLPNLLTQEKLPKLRKLIKI